jgi:hypothetical protein
MNYSINVFQVKPNKSFVNFTFDSEKQATDFYGDLLKAQWGFDVTVKLLRGELHEVLRDTVIVDNILYSPQK